MTVHVNASRVSTNAATAFRLVNDVAPCSGGVSDRAPSQSLHILPGPRSSCRAEEDSTARDSGGVIHAFVIRSKKSIQNWRRSEACSRLAMESVPANHHGILTNVPREQRRCRRRRKLVTRWAARCGRCAGRRVACRSP
jgi:hypothetical protein